MYYLIYGILYLFSLLPLPVLYLFSDFAYVVVYYLIGYRKKVVMDNLGIAFPEKTYLERKEIAKKFFHQFTDTFIEAIKMISISREAVEKRVTIDDRQIREIASLGKSVQIHAMHNFNWEVVNLGMARRIPLPLLVVYMPIKNKHFERIFYRLRTKTGTKLLRATRFKEDFHAYLDQKFVLVLVADQSPGSPATSYWADFFSRLTPFVKGPEKGAKLNDAAVVFCNFYRTRRGHYQIELTLQTTEPRSLPNGELTLRFVRYTEACIRKNPENYLWSHRRWKRPFKEEYRSSVLKDEDFNLMDSV